MNDEKYKPKKIYVQNHKHIHHKYPIKLNLKNNKSLPESVDLRKFCPPVYDQGNLGSCTANALAGCYQIREIEENMKNQFTPSRLFIYYCERNIEGTVNQDSGALMADGIKVITKVGVCDEKIWPYDISKFNVKPPQICYVKALKNKCLTAMAISNNIDQLKISLSKGYPIVLGISVYESFESETTAETGIISVPNINNEQYLGGHAVCLVGWQKINNKEYFILRNSWGVGWGYQKSGYAMIPSEYLANPNLASEFYSIQTITCN